jgi:hypothetical protein
MSTLAWSNAVRSALHDSSPFAPHSISLPAAMTTSAATAVARARNIIVIIIEVTKLFSAVTH